MTLDALIKDFPEQFKHRKNIGGLTSVLDRQLAEVCDAFNELNTQRSLDTAVGRQLDRAGDIVCLTRAQAGLLGGAPIEFDVLNDDRYRKYLKYTAYKNSNDCTYYDIVKELMMVWDVDSVMYSEDESYPATIIISAPLLSPSGGPANLGQIPAIKPAGVSVLYQYRLRVVIQATHRIDLYTVDYPLCGTMLCGTYPNTATRGNSCGQAVQVGLIIGNTEYFYTACGTKPQEATVGTASEDGIETVVSAALVKNDYVHSGTAACGKYF